MELADFLRRRFNRSNYNYGSLLAPPSYGSLPTPPAPSSRNPSVGSAGIRPNFNQPWQGDMSFPTLGAAASASMAAGSRAQRRSTTAGGPSSGRGRGGQQQDDDDSDYASVVPRGGSVFNGKVIRTTMRGFPPDAPDPRRAPRGQGAQTPRQKRKMANLLKNPRTGASFMEDLQASQAATATRFGSPPITLNDRPRGNPFTDTDVDIGVGSVRTVSREDAIARRAEDTARRFATMDQRLESTTEVNEGGIRVPKRDLADEYSQLAQREADQQARDRASASSAVPQETVELSSGRTVSLDRTIGERSGVASEEPTPELDMGEDWNKRKAELESKLKRNKVPERESTTVNTQSRASSRSSRSQQQVASDFEEFKRQQQQVERQQQTTRAASIESARRAGLVGLEVAPGEGSTTPIGRPRKTIRGMSVAVQNIIKMSEEAKKANAKNT